MCSFSEEVFLKDFFIFDIVVGKFCDRRAIFDRLAEIYYIDNERAGELYTLATSKKVADISTLSDYKRYCRLRAYLQTCGLLSDHTDIENDILAIKGKAMHIVSACELIKTDRDTMASVYSVIVEKANAGQVTALRLYGVLQCEGIFFKKRVRDGIKNLTRAARWNSIESLFALLKYDAVNSKAYMDMIHTLTGATPYEEVFACAKKNHAVKDLKKVKEPVLLSKIFGRGQIDPGVYIPVYANFLYSEIVPFKDKETLLLSESKDTIVSYRDLPLKLSMRKLTYDVSAVTGLSLARSEERNGIIRNALNSDIRDLASFKPLCLCSDSKFMRDYYVTAITDMFGDAHIEYISVADLCQYDLEPSINNIFIRSCDEDKNNVFILSFVGDIDDTTASAACDFLQSAKRKKMRLVRPGIEIDLGAILPICVGDRENCRMLARYCEKIEIGDPSRDEMPILIRESASEKKRQYGIAALNIEESVMSKLCSISVDDAEEALDIAIATNRDGENPITLTEENTERCFNKRVPARKFGYGGCKDGH